MPGANETTYLLLLLVLCSLPLGASAAELRCPAIDYPPGVDAGAASVQLRGRIEADGRLTLSSLDGPDLLVRAVLASLELCEVSGEGEVQMQWLFPEPPIHLSGTLWSRGDRARLPGVTVLVGERSAVTDENGRFSFRNLPSTEGEIRISDPRLRLREPVPFSREAGERLEVDLWVSQSRDAGDEIVAVYSGKEPISTVRTVALDEAKVIPGSLGDPLRALSRELGLARSPLDAGWLLVRGADYDETGLFLDGVRIPLVYHLGGFTSVLHPEMIESVNFWPGLPPARYGDTLSGAVDLISRPIGARPRVVGGMNTVFAHAYTEVPARFGGIALAARRSWLDAVIAAALGGEASQVAPRFWDVSSRVTLGEGHVTFIATHDAANVPSFEGTELLDIAQNAAQIQGSLPLPGGARLTPWIAFARQDITGGTEIVAQRIDELYPGLRLERPIALPEGASALLGAEIERRGYRLLREDAGGVRSEGGDPVWILDPYASIDTGGRTGGSFGLRLQGAVVEGDPRQPVRTGLSPRASVRVGLPAGLSILSEWGRLYQLPPPQLLVGIVDGAYLAMQRSDQISAGVAMPSLRLSQAVISASATVFTRLSEDLAELERDLSIGPSQARASGLESSLRISRGPWSLSLLYQHTSSDKREDPDETWLPYPFETPHRFEAITAVTPARSLQLSARFRYVSGFPRQFDGEGLTPTVAYDLLRGTSVSLPVSEGDVRLAPFHALDLHGAYTFTMRRWQLDVGLDIQNLYSRRVPEPAISGFGEAAPSYGYGLPILPIFSLDGRF